MPVEWHNITFTEPLQAVSMQIFYHLRPWPNLAPYSSHILFVLCSLPRNVLQDSYSLCLGMVALQSWRLSSQ